MDHLDRSNSNNPPPIPKQGSEEEGSICCSVVDILVFQYESRKTNISTTLRHIDPSSSSFPCFEIGEGLLEFGPSRWPFKHIQFIFLDCTVVITHPSIHAKHQTTTRSNDGIGPKR
jgi:hypothetical protein